MSELNNRMIRDMQLAGLVEEEPTARYLRAVRQLAAYYLVSPDQLSERNVEDYLLYVRDDLGVAKGTFVPMFAVNDRPSRLFSAKQEAPAYPRVGTGSSVSPWLNFGCRDAVFGRSMKCHPVEGGRPSPTPSFSLRSGSTARTVGCSPVPCPQPPRRARSTTSAISGD